MRPHFRLLFPLLVLFAALAHAGLKSTPPKDVDLTGLWELNAELSDDPKAILDERREKAMKGKRRPRGDGGMGSGPPRVRERPQSGNETVDEMLATREQIDIKQEPGAYTLSNNDQSISCKPGEVAKVSMRDGYTAEQQCGWDGKTFVIELKSPIGLTRVDHYEWSKKTDQLIITTEIEGGRGPLKDFKIKRTYDRLVAR